MGHPLIVISISTITITIDSSPASSRGNGHIGQKRIVEAGPREQMRADWGGKKC
jgi:hypothetical protein